MNRLLIFLLLCFIALCAGLYISFPQNEFSIGSFSLISHVQSDDQKTVKAKEKIRFVGDIMFARNVEYLMDTYGYGYPFSGLDPNPDDAFLVGNFESSIPVMHVPTPSMHFSFASKPAYLQGLSEYGFTHLGLANNHAYDFGIEDYKNTVRTIEDAELSAFGDPGKLSSSSVSLIEAGSSTVALIGVYAVHTPPSNSDIIETLKYANMISDIQIAYVHFGDEYKPVHNGAQERLAHIFVDAGADAVIGHHPHVVQDIELYKNALIFYSLGNFIFDQYFSEEVQTGLMTELSVTPSKLSFSLYPVTSIGTRSVPRFMAQFETDAHLKDLAKKSDTELGEMILGGLIEIGRTQF